MDSRHVVFGQFRYQSGELIRKGDRILYHGEPGEIEFVADSLTGDQETDWFFEEFPGGGVMLIADTFGRVFLEAGTIDEDEDLEFVSRAIVPGP